MSEYLLLDTTCKYGGGGPHRHREQLEYVGLPYFEYLLCSV